MIVLAIALATIAVCTHLKWIADELRKMNSK